MLPDISNINTLGGAFANYQDPVDTSTDEDAKFRNMAMSDVVEIGHTAPRAILSFVGVNGANPADPGSGFIHDAMWGSSATYKPLSVRTSEGLWTITYPGTGHAQSVVPDELTGLAAALGGGVTHALNFRRAYAQVQCDDGVLRHVAATVTGPNTVVVRGWTAAGALDDLVGQVITVWIY